MINDVYSKCPTYKGDKVTLRQTILDDADDLLKCYSDEKVVSLFNYKTI
jgi:ribosomal-protein-alanine N-acetyltransferase